MERRHRILREHPTTPRVKCMYCGDEFTAGATLIRKHMLDKCTCDTDAFCVYKDKLNAKHDKKQGEKRLLRSGTPTRSLGTNGGAYRCRAVRPVS